MRWFLLLVLASALNAALSVDLTLPMNATVSSLAAQTFSFTVSGNVSACSLYTNQSGWSVAAGPANVSSFNATFSESSVLWAVSCTDGNQTVFSSNRSLTVDLNTPAAPANLNASGNSTANVSWNASSDFTAVTYQLSKNGTLLTSTTTKQYADTVIVGQTYNYSIVAVDAANHVSLASLFVYHVAASNFSNSSNSSNASVGSIGVSGVSVTPQGTGAIVSWSISSEANASLLVYNATGYLVASSSNANLGVSHSLSVSGLLPVTAYSFNVTSCNATACGVSNGSFSTLFGSVPGFGTPSVSSSTLGTSSVFSVLVTDSIYLSSYVFSSNASGTWVNTSYAFAANSSSGTASHTLVLPSSVATVSWLFYANNSQGGLSVMAVQNVSVSAPAATPIPTATIVPTPIATIPPSLVKATPTPTPTANVQATATLLPAATPTPSAIVEPKREGKLLPLTLEAQNAEYGISPSGLVVSVAGLNASVVFTSNFTNNGDDVTVLLQAHLSGSTQEYDLYSQPVSVKKGDTVSLSTEPLGVIGGLYEVVGEVVDADTQMVLSTQSARIDVRTISGRVLSQDGPVLLGLTLLLFGAGGLITLRMRELEKEF